MTESRTRVPDGRAAPHRRRDRVADLQRAAESWLEQLTASWVAEDLITPTQRDRILRHEAEHPSAAFRPGTGRAQSIAVEALGYLGGVIVVVAVLLLGSQVWDEIGTGAHLALVGGGAVLLGAVGAAVPRSAGAVGIRLRSVMWLATVPATAGFFAVLGTDVLDLEGTDVGVLASGGATLVAAALWVVGRGALQQLVLLVSASIATAVTIVDLSSSDSLPGLGVWCVGITWAAWAWGGVVDHRVLGLPAGAAVAIVGGLTMIPTDAGTVLALLTAGGVVATAVLFRDLLLLAVGAVGSLLVLPAAVTNWWPDRLAAPLALMALGVVLLLAALQVARRRRSPRQEQDRADLSNGTPTVAWLLAAPVLGVLIAVLVGVAVS